MAAIDPRLTTKIIDLAAFRRLRSTERLPADPKPTPAVSGGAWYHEAAIREDDRTRGR